MSAKKICLAALVALALAMLCSCSGGYYAGEDFAMDTLAYCAAYGPNARESVGEAFLLLHSLEGLLSNTIEGSDISALNAMSGKGRVSVSDDTMEVLQKAVEAWKATEGAFDPTLGAVVSAWGITTDSPRVPGEDELSRLLAMTGADRLKLYPDSLEAELETAGMVCDLGGIGKGYACARMVEMLKARGISSAVISLGGNVGVLGKKPGAGKWRIGVRDPGGSESDIVGYLEISDTFAATSGSYERYFEQDGKRYHHILDPATGRPAESGLVSVTVVCADGTLADAYSTAFFVMGLERSLELISGLDGVDALFITDDGQIYVTEGIKQAFTLTSKEYRYYED